MKKKLKFVGILALAVVALLVVILIKAALTPAVPKDYTESVKTGGICEQTYLKNGSYDTAYFEQTVSEDFEKYEIWYPEELSKSDRTYPVIVMLNGTGVKASKYEEQFRHYASWGFIVIGTEEPESWDGVAADASLGFLIAQNDAPDSIFYHKVDLTLVAAVGHSQGGAGVFNAITELTHSSLYKTAVSLSPTHEEQAKSLGWHYDLSKVRIPILLFAGTKGDFEMNLVIPTEAMHAMYDKLNAPKVMARKLDCEHGEMLYSADGYVTAWLMWRLQGDEEAAKAFLGDRPELFRNTLYQEQQSDLGE